MLAASEPGLVDQLLLLSYPLHPPQKPEEFRAFIAAETTKWAKVIKDAGVETTK